MSIVRPYLILFGIFLLEGLGFLNPTNTIWILVTVSPLFLLHTQKQIPKKFFIIYALFLITIVVTFPFAVELDQSLMQVLKYIFFFLVILRVYNDQSIKKYLVSSILAVTGIFSIIFLCNTFLKIALLPIPVIGEQFIYTLFGHNNLGHLAAVSSLVCIYRYFENKSKKYLFVLLIFLTTLIFSFSRTSYLAFSISLAVFMYVKYKKQLFIHNRKSSFILSITIIAFILLFISINTEARKLPVLKYIYSTFHSLSPFPDKSFTAMRPVYWSIALKGIQENPLTGIGGGNYYWLYSKHEPWKGASNSSSHNISLDSLVEYGLIGGTLFSTVIILILVNAMNAILKGKENVISYIVISMFVSMQFDFVHAIPIFLLLYFMLGISIYKEKEEVSLQNKSNILILVSVILVFISFQRYFSQKMYERGEYMLSIITYPFSSQAWEAEIGRRESVHDKKGAREVEKWYKKFISSPEQLHK